MKKNMYALFDKQTNTYLNPLHFVTDADAIRWLTTIVNDNKSQTNINLYPHQFILIKLGSLDDQNGKFDNEQSELLQGSSVQEEKAQYTIEDMIKLIQDK